MTDVAGGAPGWREHRLVQRLRGSAGRLASFADQGFQGVANVAILALLARGLAVDDFASIGLMIGLYYMVFSLHRSSIVLPYILESSEAIAAGEGAEERRGRDAAWWTASLAFAGVATLLLCIGTAAALAVAHTDGRHAWVARALWLLTPALPLLLAGEFGRRVLYQEGRPSAAAAASAAYMGAGVLVALAAIRPGLSPVAPYAFAAAGLGSTVAFLISGRPCRAGLRRAWQQWRPHRDFAAWQSLTSIFFVLYTSSAVVLVGTFAGATAAAVYTAARTLVNPALSIVSAVDSLDKPRAAHALAAGGIPALAGSIERTRRLLLLLTGSYLAAVAGFAPWLLRHVLGGGYDGYATATRILALGFLLMCLNQPSETKLVVLRSPRRLFVVRAATALLAVAAIWLGGRQAGVTGTAVAILAVQAFALVALRVAERLAERGWRPAGAGEGPEQRP